MDCERLLTDMLSKPRTPYVGLLLHWYGRGFDEPIALQGRVSLPLWPRVSADRVRTFSLFSGCMSRLGIQLRWYPSG
jgi:hypothetical protein